MDQQPNAAGTLLIFHLITDGQVYKHAVSYAYGINASLRFDQLASIVQADRAILVAPGVVSFVGSVSGSYDDYLYWYRNSGIHTICPVCTPTMKGRTNE